MRTSQYRPQGVSAVRSGDETDYSVLPMDELLVTLEKKLGERFPGFVFECGYTDHAYTCGSRETIPYFV